jgi:O-antigen ligase
MIILKNPLLGVGLGNFIAVLPTQNQKTEIIWWLQPVHNIYLLGLSEIGVIPVLVLLIISSNMWRTKKIKILVSAYPYLVLIMLSGILDHYWLTQQQTMILLSVILPLGIEEKKNI